MKTYLYKIEDITKPRDNATTKRCTIYRVIRNKPVQIGRRVEQYASDGQMARDFLLEHKLIPKACAWRYENEGTVYHNGTKDICILFQV